jgi:hypothetical protein
MLIIPIPKDDLALLDGVGAKVRINFHDTVIRRDGGHLCYTDAEGQVHRCRILSQEPVGELECRDGSFRPCVRFTCQSHGMDDEPYSIIREDGSVQRSV